MKKTIIALITALLTTIAMTGSAFAQIQVDYDLNWISEPGGSVTITVDMTGEDSATAYSESGLSSVWGDWLVDTSECQKQQLTIYRDYNATPGEKTVFVRGTTLDSGVFVHVLLVDNSELEITNVVKKNGKVKVTWTESSSGSYQLQYREKDGSWKNAAALTDKTSWSTSNLKKGTKYEFRVRTVTKSYYWPNKFGSWSEKFTYKVK